MAILRFDSPDLANQKDEYGFNEKTDYAVFTQMGANLSGGLPTHEYQLTIDAAKKVAAGRLALGMAKELGMGHGSAQAVPKYSGAPLTCTSASFGGALPRFGDA
ncbi:antA/AntB antirepressor family protein, partial [Polaromonas hydrogenivorans]